MRWLAVPVLVFAVVYGLALWTLQSDKPANVTEPLVVERSLSEMANGIYHMAPDFQFYDINNIDAPLGRGVGTATMPLPALPVPQTKYDPQRSGYAGIDACAECHKARVNSFKKTAHFKTSSKPTEKTVKGDFNAPGNIMKTGSDEVWFEMEKEGGKFYQKGVIEKDGQRYTHREPIDIVTGSGKIGQTYLYWKGSQLYELPVSYFKEVDTWTNSPGYTDATVMFARPIVPRCLECHATYVEVHPVASNSYVEESFMYGVTCESCHGPGRAHVQYHQKNPNEKEGKRIVNPSQLTPQRSTDICSRCHAGGGRLLKPAFSFVPGSDISEYMGIDNRGEQVMGGVHTDNQYARLKMSQCFQATQGKMTCAECHNPHKNEHDNLALFSERCRTCHKSEDCGKFEAVGPNIRNLCIDCHMPKRRDGFTEIQREGGNTFPSLRDHYIKPYPKVSEQLLKAWGRNTTGQ